MVELPTTVIGLMSLIIVTLCAIIARLYFQNIELYKQINTLQDKRVEEAKEINEKLVGPLNQISQYVKLSYKKLTDGSK